MCSSPNGSGGRSSPVAVIDFRPAVKPVLKPQRLWPAQPECALQPPELRARCSRSRSSLIPSCQLPRQDVVQNEQAPGLFDVAVDLQHRQGKPCLDVPVLAVSAINFECALTHNCEHDSGKRCASMGLDCNVIDRTLSPGALKPVNACRVKIVCAPRLDLAQFGCRVSYKPGLWSSVFHRRSFLLVLLPRFPHETATSRSRYPNSPTRRTSGGQTFPAAGPG